MATYIKVPVSCCDAALPETRLCTLNSFRDPLCVYLNVNTRVNLQELFRQFRAHHFIEFRMSMLYVIALCDKSVHEQMHLNEV
jgi:hypothetical protein